MTASPTLGLSVCVRTRSCHTGNNRWVPHCPDFLQRFVALIHSMRLSLMKGAHAELSSTAWQEIGVKPSFGLSGLMALNVPLLRFSLRYLLDECPMVKRKPTRKVKGSDG